MKSDKILLGACFAVLFLGFFSSSKGVGCFSEFERANKILMHTPTTELFWALIHPEAALYEEFFNSSKLSSEHKSYIELLKSNGIEVCTVEELFYKGVLDETGNVIEGDDLSSLRNFAKDALVIDSSCLSTEDQVKQLDYKDKIIANLQEMNNNQQLMVDAYKAVMEINEGYLEDVKATMQKVFDAIKESE